MLRHGPGQTLPDRDPTRTRREASVVDVIEIPESNRWADFVWPEWVPAEDREAIEKFWGPWHGGPREWVENAAAPYNNAPTGTRVRMWGDVNGHRVVVVGRYVHRWNNIGRVVLDDGSVAYAHGGIVTDERIAAERERRVALVERAERELERLRASVAALDESIREAARKDAEEADGPYPCPGCQSFPGEPHPPYCPDAAIEARAREAQAEAGHA